MPPVEHVDLDALLNELASRREAGDKPGMAQGCLKIASALIQTRNDANADPFLIEGMSLFRDLGDRRGVAAMLDWIAEAIRRREEREQAARTEEAVKALAFLAPDDALAAALAFDPAATDAPGRKDVAERLEDAAGAIRERLAREGPVDPGVAELTARMRASGMFIAPDFRGALSEEDAVALALEALASDAP